MVRLKNRYFLIEVIEENGFQQVSNSLANVSQYELLQIIKNSILKEFGDFGLAQARISIQIKLYNAVAKIFMIKIARNLKNILWNSITFINEVKEQKVRFKILACSATIKQLEQRYFKILTQFQNRIMKNTTINGLLKKQLTNLSETIRVQLNNIDN